MYYKIILVNHPTSFIIYENLIFFNYLFRMERFLRLNCNFMNKFWLETIKLNQIKGMFYKLQIPYYEFSSKSNNF